MTLNAITSAIETTEESIRALREMLSKSQEDRDAFCFFLHQVRKNFYQGDRNIDLLNATLQDARNLGFKGSSSAWEYLVQLRNETSEDKSQIPLPL